jgi:hypothetical protein
MLADIKYCTVVVSYSARTVDCILFYRYGQSDSNFPVAADSLLHLTSPLTDRVKHLLSNLATCLWVLNCTFTQVSVHSQISILPCVSHKFATRISWTALNRTNGGQHTQVLLQLWEIGDIMFILNIFFYQQYSSVLQITMGCTGHWTKSANL